MTRMTFAALAAIALTALLIGAANIATKTSAQPAAATVRQAGAPPVNIDVFELMGRALGELPVEQADMH